MLRDNEFTAARPSKFYLPKASGTTRPITLLTIQDSILYQAFGNVIGRAVRPVLRPAYNKTTFSNQLNDSSSIYFFKPWKDSYKSYVDAQKEAYSKGLKWVAEFDFASFYDVVGHKQLFELLSALGIHDDLLRDLQQCLEVWTEESEDITRGHGIPQGPLTSNLLAECFLHNLDKEMAELPDTQYLRYVDDIKIFAESQKPLQAALVKLDLLSKRLGLIPQITKERILEITDIGNFVLSSTSGGVEEPPFAVLTDSIRARQRRIRRQFQMCFSRKGELKSSQEAARTIRFTLFNLRQDKRLLPRLRHLVYEHPEFSDPTNAYLRRFGEHDGDVANLLFGFLESEPLHDWHIARCLETLIIIDLVGQYGRLRDLCKTFRKVHRHPFLRAVACLGLMPIARERRAMTTLITKGRPFYLQREALANSVHRSSESQLLENIKTGLAASQESVALCAAYLLSSEGLKLPSGYSPISPWASPILASEGIIPKTVSHDRIAEILRKKYKLTIPLSFDFRSVLGTVYYKRALGHLMEAERSYKTQRSRFVSQMDNFNQILLKALFKKYPSHARIPWNRIWSSINYKPLNADCPIFAHAAKSCHRLRTSSPEPHPYSQTLGSFGREVTVGQRNRLVSQLKGAYREFVSKA